MNNNIYQGMLNGDGKKIAIVISRFNNFISKHLLDGAIDSLVRHQVKKEDIDVFYVPGAFEIPQATAKITKTKKYDAIICLGAIIRGETPHFEFVSSEASKGIAKISLESNIPIGYGIITADSTEQAIERAGTKMGNKGYSTAETVIELINLYEKIK